MKNLLHIPGYILAFFRAIFAFVTIAIYVLVYIITIPIFGNTHERGFKLRRKWIALGMKIFGIRLINKGVPLDQPALYVSNHLSFTDPIATCKFIDAFVIAKAEVGNIPLLSKGAEMTGVIYVDRGSKSSRSNTRKALVDTLASGKNVLVYPEGTVSQNSIILPYKAGAFREAFANDIPIVPIAIAYGAEKDIWNNTGLVGHFFKQLSYWRTEITQEIGTPITGVDGDDIALKANAWTKDIISQYRKLN